MLVRPVMKRLFFSEKPRKKRLASLARLIKIPVIYRTTNCDSQCSVPGMIPVWHLE